MPASARAPRPSGRLIRSRLLEVLAYRVDAVVDGGVEAQPPGQQVALGVRAGDADDVAAADLRHLADEVADRATRRADDGRLPRLWSADVVQSEVCRQA